VEQTKQLPSEPSTKPHLKRVLTLWDLIYFGVILTSPIAAVPLFGEAQVLSHGHTTLTMLLAMVAMSVTAVSFGRMATVYPSAGSVYTYISRGMNPHIVSDSTHRATSTILVSCGNYRAVYYDPD
jgi:amino acid transporter